MSLQSTIEAALLAVVGTSIPTAVQRTGPIPQPRAEGSGRVVSVRKVSSAATRLEFAQSLYEEAFLMTFYWVATIARGTCLDEWEAVRAAFAAAPGLGLSASVPGLERAYVASESWGEAHDGHFRILSVAMTVERVE